MPACRYCYLERPTYDAITEHVREAHPREYRPGDPAKRHAAGSGIPPSRDFRTKFTPQRYEREDD